MTPNTWKVARWEFIKNLKNPAFLVLTFMIPVIMLASGFISYITTDSAARRAQNIAVIDETGDIFPLLEARLFGSPVKITRYKLEQREQLAQEVAGGRFNGYLYFSPDDLSRGVVCYYVKNIREQNTMVIAEGVKDAVTLYRLNTMGLNPDQVQQAIAPVTLQNRALTGEEGSLYDFLVPFIFGIILTFSAMFSGQVLMYGVIKEKRNRIVEILLSSISSLDLLLGKIIGFGALGLLQIVIWIAVGLIVAHRFLDLAQLSLGAADLIPPLLFFFGGYLLFSSLYAALGATMKDAEGGSQMQGMVVLVPMIPLFASSAILMAPNAPWVRLFSFLPPFIPVTMLIRVSATTLPWWEIAASFTMLLISVAFFIYLGARIFSRGILQFDRTLSFKEIGKMLTE